MVRETPLHVGQIRLLQLAAEIGATVFPPVPAFYHRPKTIEDIVHQSCARALDQLGLHVDVPRWHGVAEQLRASGSM
jgi:4-hydroxy-3-polyprenylbenzoate decarboxylase